jgi:hypothetical protein
MREASRIANSAAGIEEIGQDDSVFDFGRFLIEASLQRWSRTIRRFVNLLVHVIERR